MSDKEMFIGLLTQTLMAHKDSIAQQWQAPAGTRTRHFIIDNLLPEDQALRIYQAFPHDGDGFFNRASFREKKKTSANLGAYPAILSDITYALQAPEIVQMVAEMVGFAQIEPDPKLYAGGLSMMGKGDFLNPHIDNSHDGERERYRRLNLLYYVTPGWQTANGGNFELWDEARTTPKTLTSQFNRLVVMETNKTSWHSVSPVVVDQARCCVSNYYFSAVSPDESDYFHVTSFSGRPEEKVKQAVGVVDNALRNLVSKTLKVGRGKSEINSKGDA